MIILPQICTKLVSGSCVLILYFLIDWQSSCLLFKKQKLRLLGKESYSFMDNWLVSFFLKTFSNYNCMLLICENSKKTVSLIEIVLGPLISAVTGVCNKKVSISTGFPRSGYANYWVSNVLNVVLFTVQLISACLYNLLREEV